MKIKFKTVVIKVGSNVLMKNKNIDAQYISCLAHQIAELKNKKMNVVLVTSGAIGIGQNFFKIEKKAKTLPEKQAAAAIGQSQLMHMYHKAFSKYKLTIAQILMTQDDFTNRIRHTNARNTMMTLLKENIVPIVNENDTVSVDQIKFGDNDTLAAYITNLINADALLILTSVDGFIDYQSRKVIKEVHVINKKIESLVLNKKTDAGTGGMTTKLKAAKMVTKCGAYMMIAHGRRKNVILDLLLNKKESGTIFYPCKK